MESNKLLGALREETLKMIGEAETFFLPMSFEALTKPPLEHGWSIGQCLEHLNLYGDHYLPTVSKHLEKSEYSYAPVFSPGILGSYAAKSMLPQAGGEVANKMKAPKDKDPDIIKVPENVVVRFIEQQNGYYKLLGNAGNVNLTKVKVPITLSRYIRFRLGDLLRFLVYHNMRHMAQAKRQI